VVENIGENKDGKFTHICIQIYEDVI